MSLHCIVWCCRVLYCWLRRAGCISQDTYLLYLLAPTGALVVIVVYYTWSVYLFLDFQLRFSLRIRIVNFATEEIVFWLKELFWRNWFPSCNIRLFLDWRKENIKSHQPSLVFNLKIILEQSRSSQCRNGDYSHVSSGLGKGSIKTSQELRMLSPSLCIQRSQCNCSYCCSQLSEM